MNQSENSFPSKGTMCNDDVLSDGNSACGKEKLPCDDMTCDEKAAAAAIDAATRDVSVPESLKPEAVATMLAREQAGERSAQPARVDKPCQEDQPCQSAQPAKPRQEAFAAQSFQPAKPYAVYSAHPMPPSSVAHPRRGMSGKRKAAFVGGIAACLVVLAGVGLFAGHALLSGQGGGIDGSRASSEDIAKGPISSAESYDEVRKCFEAYANERDSFAQPLDGDDMIMLTEEAPSARESSSASSAGEGAKSASNADTGTSASTAAGDYSETNVRTEGVDEADIVKTDGTYLYALQENATEIAVVDVRGDDMKKVGAISSQGGGRIAEFYVQSGRVYVLSDAASAMAYDSDARDYDYYGRTEVLLETFDVSDVANPRLVGSVSQSGSYRSSRLVGDYLYLFSNYYVPYYDDMEPIRYVPYVNGDIMACDDIYLPPVRSANQYVVISSVNVGDPSRVIDQKAVLTDADDLYVSTENIYVYESMWSTMWRFGSVGDGGRTAVRKIAYREGRLEGVAQTKVEGTINDSFSIDEYEGNLRLVTTVDVWDEKKDENVTTNAVYVLDEELDVLGSIEGLAEDERVYSARFFGDVGYFVTFRETDPLFSVDLSDPENPRIVGSLKIPGFSEYLHPYGEGKLLGIGMDADEKTGVTNGMKVSMFDISDPTNVKEADTFLIKKAYHSDVFNDYRAVLVSAERNLIGFSGYAEREMYYVFSYDDATGFSQLMAEDVNGRSWMGTRGLYIGDTLYVVNGNALESYRIGTFEKIDDLLL